MAEVRTLTLRDVPQAVALSTAAGWNQIAGDWERLLSLSPQSCFCIVEDDRVVSTATGVCFPSGLGWLGMVLTLPAYRGRGHAGRLLKTVLKWFDRERVPAVRLDATDMGLPLYERLGFRTDCRVERWTRAPRQTHAAVAMPPFDAGEWRAFDRDAFGADRSGLLARMDGVSLPGRGYSLMRPGRLATQFGPCVAVDDNAAQQLFQAIEQTRGGDALIWDLFADHTGAVRLAREAGFAPIRGLARMTRGSWSGGDSDRIYALAGFEYG
jgi:GNAT superfamily N-acetyltransferase